jgi:uncharacterized protein YhaN
MSGESVRQRARDTDLNKALTALSTELKMLPDFCNEREMKLWWALADELVKSESESSLARKQARKQEREECAKLVCRECELGTLPVVLSDELGEWVHRSSSWKPLERVQCHAYAIHERGRKVEG